MSATGRPLIGLQRSFERLGGVLPQSTRYKVERKVRGYLEYRKLSTCDYAVISFGKSGRTWLRVLLSRLYQQIYGLQEGLLEFDNFHAQNPAVPKIFFTHDNYLRDFTKDGSAKDAYARTRSILLVRHPADVAVSQYFQWQFRMREHKAALNNYPPQAIKLTPYEFLMGESGISRVITFMNEWAEFAQGNDNVVVVRYEDLRADTVGSLRRISNFLEVKDAEQWLQPTVDYASFEQMKARESAGDAESDRLKAADSSNPDSFKTRRAKVGGYQDYLNADEITQVDLLIEQTLHRSYAYAASTTAA